MVGAWSFSETACSAASGSVGPEPMRPRAAGRAWPAPLYPRWFPLLILLLHIVLSLCNYEFVYF